MSPVPLLPEVSFEKALRDTRTRRKHLLLGNGFSMAFDRELFSWTSLASAAGEPPDSLRDLLGRKSHDIEAVLVTLSNKHKAALLASDRLKGAEISRDVEALKEHLIRGVTAVHDSSSLPSTDHKRKCSEFLKPFIGRAAVPQGLVFTTNYDLLLYWTLVQHMKKRSHGDLRLEDGFIGEEWLPERMGNVEMSVVYLHGALHLYSQDGRVRRRVYQNGPVPMRLAAQVRARIEQGQFPLFVSEGSKSAKLGKIARNPYLTAALNKFRAACEQEHSALFVLGHRMATQDEHLSDIIATRKIRRVFFGAYGGVESDDGEHVAQLAARWNRVRTHNCLPPVAVSVFDSAKCTVWHDVISLSDPRTMAPLAEPRDSSPAQEATAGRTATLTRLRNVRENPSS